MLHIIIHYTIIATLCYTGNDVYGNRIYARGTWRTYTVICALPVYICVHTNITILYYVIQVMMYTVTAYMRAGPGAPTLLYVPYLSIYVHILILLYYTMLYR